jgi:hypothetical protein
MRSLYIDYNDKDPNYIGSFKGLYGFYKIYRVTADRFLITYQTGEHYSYTNRLDIINWLNSLGYDFKKVQ